MENDSKQKIVLEGEQQHKNAIKDAQRNLKTLRSELKAETAELGANATAQEKNAAKIKSLKAQIKEQEKIVKANKEALEEVKEKYADNADAIAKYEQKLNDSRTALANMKNELDSVGQSFSGVGANAAQATVATKSVADALGSIGDVGETVSGAMEGIFTGLMNVVADVAREIWDLIAETAAKADRWGDLAGFYGSTAEEVQKVDRAISAAGGNFEDFVSLMNTLQFKGKDKKLVEWLGLSDVNYDNEVEHTMAALELLKKKKDELGTGKFNEELAKVFGGKSSGFLQLVDKYDEIIKKSKQLEENGYLLNSEELNTMTEVNNTLASIETKWDSLKTKFAAGFGTVTLDIATKVEGAMDSIAKYFNAKTPEEKDLALKELEDYIVGMFETADKAIRDGIEILDKLAADLQGSENPTAQALGNIISGLVTALQWLTADNMNNVKTALEIFAGIWVAGKVATAVSTIAELAGNIKTIQMFNALGSLGSVGATVGTTAGSSFLSSLAAGLPAVLIAALAAVPLIDMIKNPDKYFKETKEEKLLGGKTTEENIEQALKHPEEAKQGLHKSVEQLLGIKEKQLDPTGGKTYVITTGETIPTIRTPEGIAHVETGAEGLAMTAEQWAAAQKFWDIDRERPGDFTDEEWDAFEQAFAGNEELFDKINEMMDYLKQTSEEDEWRKMTDLPAEWWQTQGGNTGNTDGMTSTDAKNMAQAVTNMPAAVRGGLSGVRVVMDGATVGRIVADEVSRQIAGYIM